MHRSRSTNLSEESFIALMDALGFVDVENHQPEEVHSLKPYPIGFPIANSNSMTHHNIPYLPQDSMTSDAKSEWRPSAFDEAVLFRQEFLADYDFGSDLDEDLSDCDYSKLNGAWVPQYVFNHIFSLGDTLPSRPCSVTAGFDTVDPSTLFTSTSRPSASLLPVMPRQTTRPRAPAVARPLALYLPDGVALGEIHSPTPSTISSMSSS